MNANVDFDKVACLLPPDAYRPRAAISLNELVEFCKCDLAHGVSPGGLCVTHLKSRISSMENESQD